MKVVIVELPAKAKTINKYLGKDYDVYASFGHVRDLAAKDGSVDPDDDFAMRWEVDAKAAKRLSEIGGAVKDADRVILATDPDREGEAISWHVLEILNNKKLLKDKRVDRVVFNAVTKDAILEAMRHPREIDEALVDAYRARRALDYLVGFTLSPVLWRKLPGARSAGRVQSVALRIVCDRELEIEKFVAREYWSIVAHLRTGGRGAVHRAPRRRRRQEDRPPRRRLGRGGARPSETALENAKFSVASVESKPVKRHPYPPFTTSTLQQEASRKLGLAPARTMQIAQRLYEGVDVGDGTVGLITYMRTDGVDLAPEAVASARRVIGKDFGDAYVPGRAAQIHGQGQERAGSARGDPPDRHDAPPARGRPPSRARAGQALRAHLDAHHRLPDGERRARAHDGRHPRRGGRAQARLPRHRPGRALPRLPRPLPGRPRRRGGRGRKPPAGDERGRAAEEGADRGEPAFHRAAAALHRGDAGQADGGARHRPSLDLRLDARGAARPRLCAAREEAAHPRGQGPAGHRLPRSPSSPNMSNTTSPPTSRRSSTGSRTARSTGRSCCATSGTTFPPPSATPRICAPARCSTASTSCSGRTSSRRAATASTRASARPAARGNCR